MACWAASVGGNLTTAETSSYQSVGDFSVSPCGSWATCTVTRGRMIAGPHGDGGKDLVLLAFGSGGSERVELLTGCSVLSTVVWSVSDDSLSQLIVRSGQELLLFSNLSHTEPEAIVVQSLLKLPAGSGAATESFAGNPVCCGDTVVYTTSSGHASPAEGRSFIRALSVAKALVGSVAASWLLYESPPGRHTGNLCLDSTATTVAFSQSSDLAHHNDILTVSVNDPAQPLLVGCEARATYGSNELGFTADGTLIYKGNCPTAASEYVAKNYTGDTLPSASHGLHHLNVQTEQLSHSSSSSPPASALIPVCGDGSGGTEIGSFCLSTDGAKALVAARPHSPTSVINSLWVVDLTTGESLPVPTADLSRSRGKLSYNTVAFVANTIFFSYTSPKDVFPVLCSKLLIPSPGPAYGAGIIELTPRTPLPLARKLSLPEEIAVGNVHCMVFRQASSLQQEQDASKPRPALLWIHGGPSGCDEWRFSGRPQYLANLGFVVITVDYRGSFGFGLHHHDAVFGSAEGTGVGVADLEDCVCVADYVRAHAPDLGVDLSRGIGSPNTKPKHISKNDIVLAIPTPVCNKSSKSRTDMYNLRTGIGGHSWGGYLTLMCMCAPLAAGVFSCGMAGAAISDLNIQLRKTELRAYDRQILGDTQHHNISSVDIDFCRLLPNTKIDALRDCGVSLRAMTLPIVRDRWVAV